LIEPRIYRAAFIPAFLAFVVAMFSLQSRPPAVPQALAADILFDGRIARAAAERLADAHPDRHPGTGANGLVADQVTRGLRAQRFTVSVDRFEDEGTDLVNVVGRRIGASTRQVVVVAARDADRIPDLAGSAADTAALLEVARTLEGRATRKTVVLASIDGSTLGAAGARRLARQLGDAGPVEAVVVISQSGVSPADGSLLVPWSETTLRSGLGLQRTVGESLRQELERGGAGRSPGTFSQFGRLAFPLGIGDQAPFIDAGFNTVRLSGSGELPPKGQPELDEDRVGAVGRATLRTVFAYDAAGRVDAGPSSYLLVAQSLLPRWSVALLVATLLLPLLAASIDSFARVRRRREPVVPWLRWIGLRVLPFLVALAVAEFLVLVGQADNPPPVPLPPAASPLDGAAGLTLGICALFFAGTWFAAARYTRGQTLYVTGPGAAAALALVMALAAIAVWAVNPFAALALLPAFHLCLLTTASPVPAPRAVAVALVLGGLLIPALIALDVLARLDLGPLSGLWYGFRLVTGHHVGLYSAVLGALLLVCFASALRIAAAREPVDEASLRR
jgi:hypothetical protein